MKRNQPRHGHDRHQSEVGKNLVNSHGAAAGANSENYVPTTLKCSICKLVKPSINFSKRQLMAFKPNAYNARAGNDPQPRVTCRSCTSTQVTELHCCVCGFYKALDKFSKNQRKNPDAARCLQCVQMHLDTEPGVTPPSSDEYHSDDPVAGSDEDFDAPAWKQPIGGLTDTQSRSGSFAASKNSAHAPARPGRGGHRAGGRSHAAPKRHDDDDDEWTTVTSAGGRARAYTSDNASGHNARGSRPARGRTPVSASDVTARSRSRAGSYSSAAPGGRPPPPKNNVWAKPPKVPKGKEKRWGDAGTSDPEYEQSEGVWVDYSRAIREKKEGKKGPPRKKAAQIDAEDDDGDDDF